MTQTATDQVWVYQYSLPSEPGGSQFCAVSKLGDLLDLVRGEFDGLAEDEPRKLLIERVQMSKAEFDNLPEFDGW